MKHATIGRRGKRCSTFRDYGGRVVGEPYPRNLAFSVTYNFRDVGGYPALDGKIVRWRRLFRADSLHRLEGDDWEAFGALGVRTVIDLRRTFEVEEHGRVPHADGLDYLNPVLEHVDWNEVPYPDGIAHERWLADRYLNFLEDGRAAVAKALSVIADPAAAPVVVHCMAGKDRTGVLSALLLDVLGVQHDVIAEDYALTSLALSQVLERLQGIEPYRASLAGYVAADHELHAATMTAFLRVLDHRHVGIEEWLVAQGLEPALVARFREAMLAPS